MNLREPSGQERAVAEAWWRLGGEYIGGRDPAGVDGGSDPDTGGRSTAG